MTWVWMILALLWLPAWSYAATFWVSKQGSDANTCTAIQSDTPPANLATGSRLTLNAGVQCLAAGDTLYVRSGTYVEALEHKIPGGTSWSNTVTVAGYPGDTVTIRPSGGTGTVLRFASASHRYIEVRGMILDGTNVSDRVVKITWSGNEGNRSSHIRIRDAELKNAPNSGIGVGGCCNEFINLKVHSNGDSKLDHGIYVATTDNLIEYSDVYQNTGYGINIYSQGSTTAASNNIVRNNRLFGNGILGGAGLLLSSGSGNIAYNNLIYGNSTGATIHYNASNSRFYNNTIFGNNGRGISIESLSTNAIVRNNISWGNGAQIVNNGSGTTISHNLCVGHASCVVTSNPLFINSAAGNFALQAGSPAINAGTSTITTGITVSSNTANPAIGAHQPIFVASGQAIDTDTVRINFINNTFPPTLVTNCTGHTLEEDTGGGFASRTVGSCQNVGGGNQLVLSSITPALSADSTLRWSYATTGNISDSALIGSMNNQRLNAVSNFSIANQIEGGSIPPPVVAFAQTAYQFFAHNSSNGLLPLTDRNRNIGVVPDSTIWIRFQMENTGDDVDEAGYAIFWTDDDWDTATRLDNDTSKAVVSGVDKIQASSSTCVLGLAADRHCAGAGFISRPVGPVPAVTMSAIGTDFAVAEFQYSVKFRSDLTSGTYCFRLRHDSGSPLDIYNRTPCVQIGAGMARIR